MQIFDYNSKEIPTSGRRVVNNGEKFVNVVKERPFRQLDSSSCSAGSVFIKKVN